MSILLCWSGEEWGTPTLLLLASIWVTPALWLCSCVAVWPRFCTLSLPDEPSPYWINHGPMALPFSRMPPYCSRLLTPPCSCPWRLRSMRFFFPLFPFASCGTCYPSSTTYKWCLCAFMLQSPLWNEGVSCIDLTGLLRLLVEYVRLQGKAEHRGPS